jgi:NADH-quinone oxidoreductase subunit L
MHHEQDMRYYGALRERIPFTFWVMVIGTLAITGVGIFGIGFAGFWSKDAILESAYASGTVHGGIAFFLGALAALLTSFYSWRLIFLTFYGEPRWAASEHIQHALHHETDLQSEPDHGHSKSHAKGAGGYHPHESPWTMLVPIGLLALGSVLAGQLFHGIFVGPEQAPEFWNGTVAFDEHLAHATHQVPLWVTYTPFGVMLIGLAIAYNNYIRHPDVPPRFVAQFGGLYRFLLNKWYFDELYDRIFVRPAMWLGRLLWHGGDEGTIDRFGPHGAAYAVGIGNKLTARLQSGYLYSYAFVMLLGLIGAASWAMWWAR